MSDNNFPMEVLREEFSKYSELFDQSNFKKNLFPKKIFQDLPNLLKYGCSLLDETTEKEVFLMGALGVISGILPNVIGYYHNAWYHPNLYVYVLGNYGTGKGTLRFSKELGKRIHQKKKESGKHLKAEYEMEMIIYQEKLKEFKKTGEEPPEEPSEPGCKMLYLPANNSRTGLFELISDNNEEGIIFETEGDTLAEALKSDFGNYSDGFRNAFHHESISYYRRTGKESVEIESPRLSAVLSSTYDQLFNLIPTAENGLFSRFLYYLLEGKNGFARVFDKTTTDLPEKFEELGEIFSKLYDELAALERPIKIEPTKDQAEKFYSIFKEWTEDLKQYVSEDLDGTVRRLGLICFRIAMIFTILRFAEKNKEYPEELICNDVDFDNALSIVSVLKDNAIKVFFKLPQKKKAKKDSAEKLDKIQQEIVYMKDVERKTFTEIWKEGRYSSLSFVKKKYYNYKKAQP